MKKRILSILLALQMLVPMTACSETTTQDDTAKASDTVSEAAATEAVETEVDEYQLLLADVPTEDYEGFTFNMLNNESNFAFTRLDAEEINGEGLNDAIYNRNVAVEDKLNISIVENMVGCSEVTSMMSQQISSGDKTYSACWNESHYIASLAVGGSLYNIHNTDVFDFEKPWWNESIMKDVEIAKKRFFLIGDMHLMFKECFQMVGYNKSILDAHALADPYELVHEGTWTMDVMRQHMDTAMQDKNGNGIWEDEDIYGVAAWNYAAIVFMTGGDVIFSTKNEDDIPELMEFDDHFYAVYEKMVETLFLNKNYMCDGNHAGIFHGGKALFYSEPVGSLKGLRTMEDEFGIVPVPKFNEEQESHISDISRYAAFCGIPVTVDLEQTAVILENFCAYSFGELKQAYENDTLNFKYIRDKESSEMLQLIFETGRFKLTDALGVTALTDSLCTRAESGTISIASTLQTVTNSTKKMLDKAIDKILKLEN